MRLDIDITQVKIREELEDLGRQGSKICLFLRGQDVPRKTSGETDAEAAEVFRRVAQETFGVHISKAGSGEWSTAHRVGQSIIVRIILHNA